MITPPKLASGVWGTLQWPQREQLLLALFFLAALMVYLPAIAVLPFGDDWEMFAWAEQYGAEVFYSQGNFRVWQRLLFALAYPLLGDGVLPLVIGLSIAVFLMIAGFITWIARRVAPELTMAPLAVAVLYLFHPANASAVVQIDTFSQNLADFLALLTIQQIVFSAATSRVRSGVVAVSLTVCVLFAKETALGVLAWIPVAVYLRTRYVNNAGTKDSFTSALMAAAAVAFGIALYMWIKTEAGTPMIPSQTGRYAIQLEPTKVVLNAIQLWGAALYYGDVATLFVFGLSPKVFVSGLLSILLLIAATLGLIRYLRKAPETPGKLRGDAFIWCSFAAPAVVPVVFMGSVSELYSAGIVPFVALGLGLCCANLYEAHKRAVPAAAAVLFLLPVAGWGGISLSDKLSMHRQVSERTWEFVRAVRPLIPDCAAPKRAIVEGNLADTTSGGRPYSVFSHPNERILRNVMLGVTEPYRAAWLSRTAWAAMPPGDPATHCEVQALPGAACVLHCEAGLTPESKILACRVLKEHCADTRK